jgi:UDP-N-acetylmuramoyl-tripeptide--D-alanyl-D-alanine ligase
VGGVTVIDDTYNASIRSVQAALREAGETPLPPGGRRFLVLGDLLELGEHSAPIHRQIGTEAVRNGTFAGLISVGPESRRAAEAAAGERGAAEVRAESLERVEEVAARLAALLAPGDLVLFKASRGVALDRAAEELRRLLGANGAAAPAGGKEKEAGGIRECCSISIN